MGVAEKGRPVSKVLPSLSLWALMDAENKQDMAIADIRLFIA
jgi:hypothetical protein